MRRLCLHVALFVMLVLAQQQSVAHQIMHAAQDASQQDPGRDNNKNCDKCLALAHLGDSVPTTQLIFLGSQGIVHQALAADAAIGASNFRAYRSRAPPALS